MEDDDFALGGWGRPHWGGGRWHLSWDIRDRMPATEHRCMVEGCVPKGENSPEVKDQKAGSRSRGRRHSWVAWRTVSDEGGPGVRGVGGLRASSCIQVEAVGGCEQGRDLLIFF